jgi:hypothetical protein
MTNRAWPRGLSLAVWLVSGTALADGPAKSPRDCVVVTATAPFVGYAHNHVVVVKNTCERPVSCEIWTDVDPSPRHNVSLKQGESASLLIRKGSPASAYKAESACKF